MGDRKTQAHLRQAFCTEFDRAVVGPVAPPIQRFGPAVENHELHGHRTGISPDRLVLG